jgi:hypothetical protein
MLLAENNLTNYCPAVCHFYFFVCLFQDYAYGLRDAVVDYQTREIYCQRNRHNHRGSCHKQPLRRVLLLGNVLSVNGNVVMMCPQEKCGRPMVVNANCSVTQRGRACCYCTQKEQSMSVTLRSLINYYTKSEHIRRCCVCEAPFSKTSDVYVYPFRIYVCRRHQSNALIQQVKLLTQDQIQQTDVLEHQKRCSMEAYIIEVVQQRETANRQNRVLSSMPNRKRAKLEGSSKNRKAH